RPCLPKAWSNSAKITGQLSWSTNRSFFWNVQGKPAGERPETNLSSIADKSSRAFLIRREFRSKERLLAAHHPIADHQFFLGLHVGRLEHDIGHDFLDDGAQAASAGVAFLGAAGDLGQGLRTEIQLRSLHLEELLVLPDQGIARLGEDADQRVF